MEGGGSLGATSFSHELPERRKLVQNCVREFFLTAGVSTGQIPVGLLAASGSTGEFLSPNSGGFSLLFSLVS